MKDPRPIPKQSLISQFEQAAFQNDKQKMVGLMHLIVITTSMIGGSVMYFYDMNSYLSLFLLGFVCVFGWILNRADHTGSSAVILIAALLIVIQFNIFAGYGIHDVAIIAWPAFIFFSGLLFGWRVIPYVTAIIMGLVIVTKTIPNDPFFSDYSDTGDLIVMLLILLAFSIIAISLLRGNDHLIQHLRRSDERFKAIYNSINDAILIHDAQTGAILDVNDKMLEMFGYTYPEAILLNLLAISSGIPPYTQENAVERIKKAVAEGTQQFEWQVKDKDGRLFWVDVNMRCATIADQSQVLVSVRDITERRQADEELLKFKLGIERSADAIFITDPQGVIVYTNPAFERIYGYTQSEAVGRTPQILKSGVVPPEQYQLFWATLLNKGIVAGEIINKTKDGRLITIEGSNNPILDAAGNIIGFLGVHRDISERKRAEEQVRNSEKRFHALIEHGRDNISLLAADGTLLWESPSVDNTLGYAPNQFVGHNIFELMHPDDQAWTSNMYAQVVQSPGNIQEGVFRLLHANGMWRWIECSATNLLHEPSVQAIVINYRDITERKSAEENLAQLNRLNELILRSAGEGIVGLDLLGNQTFINPAAARMLGYEAAELLGFPSHNTWHHTKSDGSPYPREECAIYAAYQDGAVHRSSNEVFWRKDGTSFPVEYASTPIYEQERLAGAVVTFTDISERKRSEEALRESEERYRTLFEQASDGIFYLSPDGKVLAVNESFARMHGYSVEEMQGMSLQDLDTPKNVQQIPERMRRIMAGEVIQFEAEHYHKDGHVFPLAVSTGLISVGGQNLIQAFHRDITERKHAEQALQESEEKYRGLVQGSPDAIVIYVDGKIVFANPASAELMRASNVDDLLGRAVIELIHPDYREFVTRRMIAAQKEGKTLPLAEEKFIRLDGTAVDVDVKAIPITFKKKSAVQIIARDITERKQRENELQAISTLSAALRTAPTRAEMLPVIVEQLVALLDCETASVEIIDPLTGDTVLEVAYGAWKSLVGTRQKSGTGINAIISQTRQPYTTNDLKHDPNVAYPEWVYEDIRGGIGAPLIAQEQLIGFLWMGRKNEIAESEVRLLVAVADIAANAIHRATLHEQTQKDASALALAYDTTLEGWAHALELRDQETEGHSRHVVQMTLDLARTMGIGEGELVHVRRGALLHDIGKMGIPDSILLKPGALDEHEWEIMRQHPEYAYKLLESIEYLHPVLDIPYCHHERWDGSGYPRGLKGEEIPLAARIFAIVDVWDALISDRPYRLAWPKEKALAHIAEQSRKHFDPAVVEAFLKIV